MTITRFLASTGEVVDIRRRLTTVAREQAMGLDEAAEDALLMDNHICHREGATLDRAGIKASLEADPTGKHLFVITYGPGSR